MSADAEIVALDRVFKVYRLMDAGVPALAGVSLVVAAGEFVAILGPSGAGKSTILNLVGGLDLATAGSVLVRGRDLAQLSERELARHRLRDVGLVWQGSARNLVPYLSVEENVALPMTLAGHGRAERRRRVRDLLEMVDLGSKARTLPSLLSGGEQQRAAVAVALANAPAVLLADEPTGEIDAEAADRVLDALRGAAAQHGCAVLMATHDLRAADRADRVLRVVDGRLRTPPRPARADGDGRLILPSDVASYLGTADLEVDIEGHEVRVRRADPAAAPDRAAPATSLRPGLTLGSDLERSGPSARDLLAEHRPPRISRGADRLPDRGVEPVRAGNREVLVSGEDLVRTYPGVQEVRALRGVSLELRSGELTMVMGPSGSGKSTLVGLLAGLEPPDAGRVLWGGRPLPSMPDGRAARLRAARFGIVFQSFGLLPTLTAEENVELPLRALDVSVPLARETAAAWLERLGLGSRMDHRTHELSAGQQQRVAVARALVIRPWVVLADEPTAEMDGEAAAVVLSALGEVARGGGAVLVATHDPGLLRAADHLIVMRDGRVESSGPPDVGGEPSPR